ncbi:MAG: hypothetical protein K2N32_02205 [Clostridia bacterium]|nr:hypothetical protein [Clostridia bacterium]
MNEVKIELEFDATTQEVSRITEYLNGIEQKLDIIRQCVKETQLATDFMRGYMIGKQAAIDLKRQTQNK